VLHHDDGVGVRAAEFLAGLPLPAEVEVVDAGTVGAEAAGIIEYRDCVVVLDAIQAGAEPGTILRLRPAELRPHVRTGMSLHDVHLLDALDETRLLGTEPQKAVVLAVQVADVTAGLGLSPMVERALGRLAALALLEAGVPADVLESATVGGMSRAAFALENTAWK
jgi:hydrogenase maturation protease